MSAEATFWAWMMGVKPASNKLVLLCLADCHNGDNGRCDPSSAYISEFTGLDRKTIPEALRALEAAGLITSIKRAGASTQFNLNIPDNPVPHREKGDRKKVIPFTRPKQLNLPRKRATPKTGYPEIGLPRKRTATPPENGVPPPPKTGHEPTKNLPIEPTRYSDPYGSGAGAPALVDNSLGAMDRLYASDNPEKAIFSAGVKFLAQYGHPERTARSFLGKQIAEHTAARAFDALMKTMIYEPVDPTAWMVEVLAREGSASPMTMDWEPPAGWAENAARPVELGGQGIPLDVIRKARDVFVLWFKSTGIRHHDWLDMFRRWVAGDWERARHNRATHLQRLATAGGLGEFVHFQT